MDRRAFLAGSTGGIAAAALILPLRAGAGDAAAQVLRLDRPAALWRPFEAGFAAGAEQGVQRLRLLGLQRAAQSRLQSLTLDALFAEAGGTAARHRAWRFESARAHGNSGSSSLVLPAAGLGLEFRLEAQGEALPRYLRIDVAHWPEGDYLVRLDTPCVAALACGAGVHGLPEGVDGFHLHLIAEADSPDLCRRADLACLQQAAEPASA
ncbi:hypothetical protein [Aquimonas voraii]|uniref:Uncharacterized protein n=1 Tax=Aquimonas voraii TaxID=265719 RepID=A0A1G6ZWF6_9GAMM|nr:hypothetical protein [Aquimonas voraii]SDE06869.1 hypothetical protein SAMN04488509_11632 [Aquimonas voraii]